MVHKSMLAILFTLGFATEIRAPGVVKPSVSLSRATRPAVPGTKARRHIMVTGAAGFIGSHAVLRLLDEGHLVTAVDNLSRGNLEAIGALTKHKNGKDLTFFEADLADIGTITAILKNAETPVEAVWHFAADAYVEESVKDPLRYFKNDAGNTMNLLGAMDTANVTNIIFASTCAVYGTPPDGIVSELTVKNPTSPYGDAKLAAEHVLRRWSQASRGRHAMSIRFFNVIGSDPNGLVGEVPKMKLYPRVQEACFNAAFGKQSHFMLFSQYPTPDKTAQRDYVHVLDIVKAFEKGTPLLGNKFPAFTAYNVGIGKPVSSKEFMLACKKVTGVDFKVIESKAQRPGDAARLYANASNIRRDLGWRPTYTSVEDMIRTAWEFKKTHKLGYATNEVPAGYNTDGLLHAVENSNLPKEYQLPPVVTESQKQERATRNALDSIDWQAARKELDIVIPTIRNMSKFLNNWREILQPYHLLIVQDGDPKNPVPEASIPEGFSYTLYNHDSITKILGEDAWIISKGDSAIRSFGFLMSKKRYVYTLDDDVFLAYDAKGKVIDAINGHLQNLKRNSTPAMFNTLYDPFSEGGTFVRGYPFSWRVGKPTGVSHGLWLNNPDYDAPTQMGMSKSLIPQNIPVVQTIPKGSMAPMCGMNLAFDMMYAGPTMYFGLQGDKWPWGRYDDMWAGWCSKVIADHLGFGFKTGSPYVWHQRASDPLKNLKKEYKGLKWQEYLIPFFQNVQFKTCQTVEDCYLELADFVEQKPGKDLDPYFVTLAKAMRIWIKVWRRVQAH